ncbi:MAG: hypothetical protein KAX50_09245 [Saprospiraceae bacterium]|nr:hypothetical protein [Saprospiraceae bacterium]
MKRMLISGVVAGAILLILSYGVLFVTIRMFPSVVEEYYNPIFWPGGERALLFFAHPFVLCICLAWFWERSKSLYTGSWWFRGAEMGLVYGVVATLPSMWITFSAISVSLAMVLTWLLYGFVQAVIAGLIFARLNP